MCVCTVRAAKVRGCDLSDLRFRVTSKLLRLSIEKDAAKKKGEEHGRRPR